MYFNFSLKIVPDVLWLNLLANKFQTYKLRFLFYYKCWEMTAFDWSKARIPIFLPSKNWSTDQQIKFLCATENIIQSKQLTHARR